MQISHKPTNGCFWLSWHYWKKLVKTKGVRFFIFLENLKKILYGKLDHPINTAHIKKIRKKKNRMKTENER